MEKENTKAPDGVGHIISNEDYHSEDRLSVSKLKMIIENPIAYYRHYVAKDVKRKDSPAMRIGNIAHALTLNDETFEDNYIVMDNSLMATNVALIEKLGGEVRYRTKKDGELTVDEKADEIKEKLDALLKEKGMQKITSEELDIACNVSDKMLELEYHIEETDGTSIWGAKIKDIIKKLPNCYTERTFYGVIDDIEFQVRPDMLIDISREETGFQMWCCIDVKTIQDATMNEFQSQATKFYYDLQQYIYTEILRQNGIYLASFDFCVGGKSETSGAEFFNISDIAMDEVARTCEKVIKKYKHCLENDEWRNGYFDSDKMKFNNKTTVTISPWRNLNLAQNGML